LAKRLCFAVLIADLNAENKNILDLMHGICFLCFDVDFCVSLDGVVAAEMK
jgi:hypothetical protein